MSQSGIYSSPAYKRSRNAYHVQCVSEYLVTILVEDAFLAKLLKSIDLPDAVIGIVSALMSLAFLVQLGTIYLMQHIRNVKRTVILIDVSSMLCFMCAFLLPFVPAVGNLRTVLVFATIGGGFLLKYLQLNLYYKWGNSFVKPENRGAFSARNEAISQAAGVVFTLVIGFMVDHFEKQGQLNTSFVIIAAVIAVLTVIDLIMLLMIEKYSAEDAVKQQKPMKEVLRNTLGNRNFRNVMFMVSLNEIAFYLTVSFVGTFKTEDLLLSMGTIQLINIGASLLRCVISEPVGRWSDRTSFAHVYRIGLWLAVLSFLLLVLTTKQTWWLIAGFTVLYQISDAFINANTNNMTYSYVPIDFFVQAQAIRSSVVGIIGFGASLVGSGILAAIQANGNMVMGHPVYAQQLLAGMSMIILLVAIAFNKYVVEKQEIMKQ